MLDLFGPEMPLAMRFFLAALIVLGLIGATAWAVRRFGIGRHATRDILQQPLTQPPLLTIRTHSTGELSDVFKILFWIHQFLFEVPSMLTSLTILTGQTSENGLSVAFGLLSVSGLFLAWIGGTLVWGLAAIMHRRPAYDLPSVFAAINENIARLEKMQAHESALNAVANELATTSQP